MSGINSNTKLMLHFNGADEATSTTDASDSNHTINFNGTAQLDTAIKKWGTASLLLDGDSDYIDIDDSSDFDVAANATEEWVIEVQAAFTDHAGDEMIISHRADANNKWEFYHSHGVGTFFIVRLASDTKLAITSGGEITDTNMHHLAAIKYNNTVGVYVDGTQTGYAEFSGYGTVTGSLYIGATETPAAYFQGNIDEVRIHQADYFSALPLPMPYAWFKCNDDAANTTVTDDGSGANNGTASANTSTLSDIGKVGDALDFVSSAYTNIDAFAVDVKADTTGTFACWFNYPAVNSNHLFSLGDATDTNSNFNIYLSGGAIECYAQEGGVLQIDYVTDVCCSVDTWHHVVVVQDGVALKVYVDAASRSFDTSNGTGSKWFSTVNDIDVGRLASDIDSGGEANFGNGLLDDVRYYQGEALSLAQDQALYNSDSGLATKADTITVPTEAYSPDDVDYAASVQTLTLTQNAPTVQVVSLPATFATTLTLNAPTILVTATPGAQTLTLSQKAPTPVNTFPITTVIADLFSLTLGEPTTQGRRVDIQVIPYHYDPIVTGGCPQCGTYLYHEGRPIRSTAVRRGRNFDKGSTDDRRYVRCARCGFVCNTDRDILSKRGSNLGWGMRYSNVAKTASGSV